MIKILFLILLMANTNINAGNKLNKLNKDYVKISKEVAQQSGWDWRTLYSFGYIETRWMPLIVHNLPHKRYITGKVKKYSIDIGWTGINSQNWTKVYEWASKDKRIKDLKLFRFPHGYLKACEQIYKLNKHDQRLITIDFPCDRSCRVSMLWYRLIIEERRKGKWNREYEALIKQEYN